MELLKMTRQVPPLIVLPLAAILLLAGCAKTEMHPLKGVVVEVYRDPPALLVDHEEIPGFMGAMTMRFEVDAATASGARKGRHLTASLRYHDGKWQLEDVMFSDAAPPAP